MDRPLPKKNGGKGKLVDFKTLVVPKDKDDVLVFSTGEEVPLLLPSIYDKEDVVIIDLS